MGTPTFVPPRSTMKTFAGVLFLVLIVASYAQAASLTINQVEKTKIKPDLDICPLCISFMNSAINDLINIIMNAGVMGSCNELCSLLPNQTEATICDLLCAYVGIEGFIDLLNDVDPDPIWICEEITVCPTNPNAAANVTSFTVQPVHGKRQDTFTFDLTYLVTNEIGTGEVALAIIDPEGMGLGDSVVVDSQAPGSYSMSFSMQASPSESEAFPQRRLHGRGRHLRGLVRLGALQLLPAVAGRCQLHHPRLNPNNNNSWCWTTPSAPAVRRVWRPCPRLSPAC